MVHGTNRNADHYFQTAAAAAFLAAALDDAVVIAPRVASADGSCRDALAEQVARRPDTADRRLYEGDDRRAA
jgi:hypothetical protein